MAKRTLWHKPVLRKEEEKGIHRPVSWLELFFDLFFVVVIASIAHNLAGNINREGLIEFVATFFPVWWVWIGATYYFERFETEGLDNRIFHFLLMIPVAGMAVFAHHALTSNFTFFVGSYIIARVIISFLWARATYYDSEFRPTGRIFTTGFILALLVGTASLMVEDDLKYILFGLALVIDFIAPFFTMKSSANLPKFSTSKLPERFGLFTIIVLGEVLIGVIGGISGVDHPSWNILGSGMLGIFIGFGLWWIYFDFVARRPFHDNIYLQYAWGYLHMPLVMCFVALGAGLLNMVGNEGHFEDGVRKLVTVAFGFGLIFIALIETILERNEDEPTHAILSPTLKIVCGALAILVGLFVSHIHTIPLLLILCALLIVIMFYGAYVWFTQEIEEVKSDG